MGAPKKRSVFAWETLRHHGQHYICPQRVRHRPRPSGLVGQEKQDVPRKASAAHAGKVDTRPVHAHNARGSLTCTMYQVGRWQEHRVATGSSGKRLSPRQPSRYANGPGDGGRGVRINISSPWPLAALADHQTPPLPPIPSVANAEPGDRDAVEHHRIRCSGRTRRATAGLLRP
ncbi:uncharacterized protein N7482_001635 [Penicillium canariense]|uniref:Uncharacterized protein n=1 Tax=Penicillium canariense TaxID=189055 RepID=A0A9W9LT50_9EURO|nr:uncharacterized protein N7482_001635 [Penicillium canariense]KAJ5175758.1 hypothetical protein N7482_001635 [Penicillium canariense]